MNRLLILAALIFTTFLGCKKVDEWTKFDLDYSFETTIEPVFGINLPFDLPTPTIKTDISEALEINNSKKDLVEDIRVKSLIATIVSPDDETFSFLNDIEISIAAEDLPTLLIAWKHDIPNSVGDKIILDILSDTNLEEYIKKEDIKLEISVKTDKILFHDVDLKVDAKFFVDAKILGI